MNNENLPNNYNNNINDDDQDMSDIKLLISSKETEIKNILLQKIIELKIEISSKNDTIQKLNTSFTQLKEAYETNLELITERDNDIKKYEEKFDSIDKVLQLKDIEISSLKTQLIDLQNKLKYEKSQRTQSNDYTKFQITKLNTKYQDELKFAAIEKEKLLSDLTEEKIKCTELSNAIHKLKINHENEIKVKEHTLQESYNKIKQYERDISKLKQDKDELNIQISKLNNENLLQVKDKISIENKVKLYETKDQENTINMSLLNQKNKFINAELDRTKQEINQLNLKIEQYMNTITDLKGDIFIHKQTIQVKEFEIEKQKLNTKLQNEKITELTSQIDVLQKEKATTNINKDIAIKAYTEQIEQLKNDKQLQLQQIETLTQKLNKVTTLSSNVLKESNQKQKSKTIIPQHIQVNSINNDDDSVDDAVNFFNNNNNPINTNSTVVLKSQGNSNEIIINELKSQLKQKELEIQRITNEYNANEAHLQAQLEEYQNKDNNEDIEQYKTIVSNLEAKVEELDKVYNIEKQKIQTELNENITRLKKENKKLKTEKTKLVQLCADLKVEVNRLENNLSLTQTNNNIIYDD